MHLKRFGKRVIKKIIKKYFVLLLSIVMFLLTVIFSVSGIEQETGQEAENSAIIDNNSLINPIIQITEIMYNPEGSDTGREWIELYIDCDTDINISRYRLNESGIKHNIYRYNEEKSCGYVIICNDCELFYSEHSQNSNIDNISLLKSSFSLSNTGEYLSILEDDQIISEIDYSGVHSSEGKSIILLNNTWKESIINGTPGYFLEDALLILENNTSENITIENSTLEDMTSEENTTNITINTTINNTENNNINNTINNTNTSIYDEMENMTQNEASEEYIETIKTCQINLSIELAEEEQYYNQSTKIAFYNRMSTAGLNNKPTYNIEYWIEDLFGNIVKNKMITNNFNQKSYTPKIDEADKVLIIKNRLVNVSCNISNDSIIEYSKIIIIRNPDFEQEECSVSETIDSVEESLGNTESFIDIIMKELPKDYEITTEIYRGNTRKSAIDISLKDISGRRVVENYHTKINEQYCSTGLVWNIDKEKLACDKEYTLIIEGLGLSEEKQIIKKCPVEEDSITATETQTQTLISENYGADVDNNIKSINIKNIDIKNFSNNNNTLKTFNHTTNFITGESIYESANQKNKRYSLIGILIMIGIGSAVLLIFLKKKYFRTT